MSPLWKQPSQWNWPAECLHCGKGIHCAILPLLCDQPVEWFHCVSCSHSAIRLLNVSTVGAALTVRHQPSLWESACCTSQLWEQPSLWKQPAECLHCGSSLLCLISLPNVSTSGPAFKVESASRMSQLFEQPSLWNHPAECLHCGISLHCWTSLLNVSTVGAAFSLESA